MDHNPAHIGNYNLPDASGHFGPYGGSFVSETLMIGSAIDKKAILAPSITHVVGQLKRAEHKFTLSAKI